MHAYCKKFVEDISLKHDSDRSNVLETAGSCTITASKISHLKNDFRKSNLLLNLMRIKHNK